MTRTELLGLLAIAAGVLCSLSGAEPSHDSDRRSVYHNQFAVVIPHGRETADQVAATYGFNNIGQIGDLDHHYLFEHRHVHKRSTEPADDHHQNLHGDHRVTWVEQQVEKKRVKRDGAMMDDEGAAGGSRYPRQFADFRSILFRSLPPTPSRRGSSSLFPDPLFNQQWYLKEGAIGGFDMNVAPAWRKGYTGKGVVISILDDGIQHNHPDIAQNYDPIASTDINDNDPDPAPRDNGDNRHGTRCAGEVAAVAFNDFCGVGVAYNSSIGGVRMLDGTVNDAVEARAISLNPEHIDIFSASWGPEDDGKTVDGPGPLAKRAFINGVIRGRHGKGSIFVWASGNGGRHTDNCNCDGYTNSIFTLSISSASQRGFKPWYLEECSSTLATTYSSGTPGLDNSVATVDMDGSLRPEHICTVEHTGTSASAPLAAGLCALALEANPDLTWRDMQHLVVMTSRSEPLKHEDGWFVNGNGRKVSHKFGYGLMDAGKLVELAERWTTVPPQHVCQSVKDRTERPIPTIMGESVIAEITTDGCAGTSAEVRYLEHVQARVSLRFLPRGNINIKLISPSGTASTLLFERPRDVFSEKFNDWPFLSVHFWGEKAAGIWKLVVKNAGTRQVIHPGVLIQWQLILHGTRERPGRLRSDDFHRQDNFPSNSPPISAQTFSRPVFRGNNNPFTASILDQIFSGSSPNATYATADGGIVAEPKESAPPGREDLNNYVESEVCHSQCSGGCSGPGPDMCRACTHYRLEGECVESCPEGTYASEGGDCLGCSGHCAMCSGPAQNQCLACQTGYLYVLHLGLCVEVCPEGYYAGNGSCLLCGGLCAECTNPGHCLRCSHNLLLSNGSCLTTCPEGFFETQDNTCGSCFPQCRTCVGGSSADCASCKPKSFLHNGKCVYRCPKGFHGDQVSWECQACPTGCASCMMDSCMTCIEGWRIKGIHCVAQPSQCSIRYFSMRNGVCQACHPTCLTCTGSSASQCLHCEQPYYLHNSECVQRCPEGLYGSRGHCLPCPHGCQSCSSYSACSQCSPAFHLYNNRCVASCPARSFSDRGVCSPCETNCKTCYGPRQDQCASCLSGSFLLGTTCHSACPTSHYPEATECLPCYQNCLTCKGAGIYDCTSCHDFFTLDGGMCIECPSGRYYNVSHITRSQACEPCSASCLTCSAGGENSCTSCQSPKSLHPATSTCRECCPAGVAEDYDSFCCSCDPGTGQCYGAVSADKRRIALSLDSAPHTAPHKQLYFYSVTTLIAAICFVNLVIFGAVFTVLQARSTGSLCWANDYSYRGLKSASTFERVSLTVTPFLEDESEEERENTVLYLKT